MLYSQNGIAKIAAALAKVQSEVGTVVKDSKNTFFKNKYADINNFLEEVIPALKANEITLLQPAFSDAAGHYVQTFLLHSSGEFVGSPPLRLEVSKDDMQQLGSAITYGRRYSLQSFLGLRAEDDDGETAVGRAAVSSTEKPQAAAPAAKPSGFQKSNGSAKVARDNNF